MEPQLLLGWKLKVATSFLLETVDSFSRSFCSLILRFDASERKKKVSHFWE